MPEWLKAYFNDRQQKQIEFAMLYAKDFHHGADGHNNMMIISKFVEVASVLENEIDMRQNLLKESKDASSDR